MQQQHHPSQQQMHQQLHQQLQHLQHSSNGGWGGGTGNSKHHSSKQQQQQQQHHSEYLNDEGGGSSSSSTGAAGPIGAAELGGEPGSDPVPSSPGAPGGGKNANAMRDKQKILFDVAGEEKWRVLPWQTLLHHSVLFSREKGVRLHDMRIQNEAEGPSKGEGCLQFDRIFFLTDFAVLCPCAGPHQLSSLQHEGLQLRAVQVLLHSKGESQVGQEQKSSLLDILGVLQGSVGGEREKRARWSDQAKRS